MRAVLRLEQINEGFDRLAEGRWCASYWRPTLEVNEATPEGAAVSALKFHRALG